MFKNFASQPANYLGYRMGPVGSNGISMTADDLRGEVTKSGDFFDFSNFVECAKCGTENCTCNDISDFQGNKMNMTGKLNAAGYDAAGYDTGGGGGTSWIDTGKDLLTGGLKYYTTQKQLEATRAAQDLQRQQNIGRNIDLQKEQEQTSQIKAYILPIAIGGGVIILGIAAYFMFRKKAKV